MKKILLVNASRYFFDEGKSLLNRSDFQVFIATDAMQALQIHRQERVDLMVVDFSLPDMTGDLLCSRIRSENGTRAVSSILVCDDSPAEVALASSCVANIFLTRPFQAKTLLQHVEKLLVISTRRGYRVLMRAKVKSSKDETVFFCTSENLSATGILIECDRNLSAGDQMEVSFFLPEAAHIIADGEVVRAEKVPDGKYRCGVRFTMISTEHQNEIEKFIEANIPKQSAVNS
jgi:DNA-binding response OmpR family regulator